MPKTSLHAFKAKDTRFVADWLKSKGLHKLFSAFEGIQEPFILSLACKSVVLNHVYIHSFRSIIKATEKFPGGGGIWSPRMDLWWGIWTAFRPREGGIWTKILQKIQMPGDCPGGDVEASIWLVHKRRSRKRKRKKWKRSDSSDSDSVQLMTLLTTPIFTRS